MSIPAQFPGDAPGSSSEASPTPMARDPDAEFVEKAAAGVEAEAALGTLALLRAASAAIRDLGRQMVADHVRAAKELKAIARKKGMNVPIGLEPRHHQALAQLETKSGKDFDSAFQQQMIADHDEAISLFGYESVFGHDVELKVFAAQTLPRLRQRLELAQSLGGSAPPPSAATDRSSGA